MPANQFGIDVADAYRTKENIEGARTRNAMSKLQLGEAQREVEQRPFREQRARERNALLTGLRGKAKSGDSNAKQQLMAIDPEGGTKFVEAVEKMDDRQRKIAQANVDLIGRLSAEILNADSAEQPALYQNMIAMMPKQIASTAPKEFSLPFIKMSLAKAKTMDQILENPTTISKGDTGEVWKGGRKIDEFSTGKAEDRAARTNVARIRASKSGSGSGGLKSSDEALMYKQAVEFLGGTLDKNNNIIALDPSVRPRVQELATLATLIMVDGKARTRTQAVKMAAQELESGGTQEPEAAQTEEAKAASGTGEYFEGQVGKDASGSFIVYRNGSWKKVK